MELPDASAVMIGAAPLPAVRVEGRRFVCGDKAGFLEANIAFAAEREELRDAVRRICRAHAGS